MGTYTQSPGSSLHKYFEDVEISPVTVKDGSLKQRFDTHLYPKKGVTATENRGLAAVTVGASSLAPVHATSVTLTATVVAPRKTKVLSGTVTFKDGTTTLGTGTLSGTGTGTATLVVAGGFTAAAHVITAIYGGVTSAGITVTAS